MEIFILQWQEHLCILQLALPFSPLSTVRLIPQSLSPSVELNVSIGEAHLWPSDSWQSHCDLNRVLISGVGLTWDVLKAALSWAWIVKTTETWTWYFKGKNIDGIIDGGGWEGRKGSGLINYTGVYVCAHFLSFQQAQQDRIEMKFWWEQDRCSSVSQMIKQRGNWADLWLIVFLGKNRLP